MLSRLKNWLSRRTPDEASPAPVAPRKNAGRAATGTRPTRTGAPRPKPDVVARERKASNTIETQGPGKNVLIRNKFLREETGTHETLRILDDSMVDTGEESGIDPYNTGGFDRSRNWDKRFGK